MAAETLTETSSSASKVALREFLENFGDLPSPPTILSQIITLTSDPTTPVYRVADTIATEPALAARMLRQSNSAFYGRSRTVSSIREAVVMLGFHAVRSMVIANTAHGFYNRDGAKTELLELMWQHSLASAVFAKMLATRTRVCNPEEAFISALMHDIGKLFLLEKSEETYFEIAQRDNLETPERLRGEAEAFGFSHPQVGAFLVDTWLFPEQLVYAIARHHDEIHLDSLTGLVGVANLFVTVQGYNTHPATPGEERFLAALETGIDPENFDMLFREQLNFFETR